MTGVCIHCTDVRAYRKGAEIEQRPALVAARVAGLVVPEEEVKDDAAETSREAILEVVQDADAFLTRESAARWLMPAVIAVGQHKMSFDDIEEHTRDMTIRDARELFDGLQDHLQYLRQQVYLTQSRLAIGLYRAQVQHPDASFELVSDATRLRRMAILLLIEPKLKRLRPPWASIETLLSWHKGGLVAALESWNLTFPKDYAKWRET